MSATEKLPELEEKMFTKYQEKDLIEYDKEDLVEIITLNNDIIEELATNLYIAEERINRMVN